MRAMVEMAPPVVLGVPFMVVVLLPVAVHAEKTVVSVTAEVLLS